MLVYIKVNKKNKSKHDLIGMVITEKDKKRSYRSEDDNLTQKEADLLLKNSNFAKQPPKENNIPIIQNQNHLINHNYMFKHFFN